MNGGWLGPDPPRSSTDVPSAAHAPAKARRRAASCRVMSRLLLVMVGGDDCKTRARHDARDVNEFDEAATRAPGAPQARLRPSELRRRRGDEGARLTRFSSF